MSMTDGQPASGPAKLMAAARCWWRGWIFAYDLVVIFVLALVAVFYLKADGFKASIPTSPTDFQVPLQAMWFGALGGIVISLKGVYDHCCARGDWDDCFDLWHIGRPISGAITGLITMVLLQAINPGASPSQSVVYTVAFIFGTQERRFFNFLSEVAALVVKVPNEDQDKTLAATAIQPSEGKDGTLVIITGQAFARGATVTFGGAALESVTVSKDGRTIAGVAPAGTGAVDVTVTNPDGTRFVLADKFTYKT